jgi:hypothetical protein
MRFGCSFPRTPSTKEMTKGMTGKPKSKLRGKPFSQGVSGNPGGLPGLGRDRFDLPDQWQRLKPILTISTTTTRSRLLPQSVGFSGVCSFALAYEWPRKRSSHQGKLFPLITLPSFRLMPRACRLPRNSGNSFSRTQSRHCRDNSASELHDPRCRRVR